MSAVIVVFLATLISDVSATDWDFSLVPQPVPPNELISAPSTDPLPPEKKYYKFRPIVRPGNPGLIGQFGSGDKSLKFRVQRQRAAIKLTLPLRRKKSK